MLFERICNKWTARAIKTSLLYPHIDPKVYLAVKDLDVVATSMLVLKEQAIAMVELQTLLQTMIGRLLLFFVLW